MILHSLDTLYDRLRNDPIYQVASSGYSLQKVSFKVVLTPTGALSAIQDAREPSGGALRPRHLLVPGHAKSTGAGLNPCLLWDNSGYMLGYKADDTNPQRTRQSFSAFRKKHVALEAEIGASVFSALCRFLEGWDPAAAQEHPVLGGRREDWSWRIPDPRRSTIRTRRSQRVCVVGRPTGGRIRRRAGALPREWRGTTARSVASEDQRRGWGTARGGGDCEFQRRRL